MEVTIWGVRGSVPAPDREQWRYGGNTPCVTVSLGPTAGALTQSGPEESKPLFILDAGTGIRELGRYLLSQFASPGLHANLLFSHYHWDHVQGLPFFAPIYTYGNTLRIFGPPPQGRYIFTLQQTLDSLLHAPFFPATPSDLHAHRDYSEIEEEKFSLDGARITTRRLNHPQGCLGYRLEADGVAVVYATDHEPGFPDFDRAVRELSWNADLLIADAHFLPTELGGQFRGWGHSSWAEAVRIARDANVKNLVLFHHEPSRRDIEVDLILRDARRQFPNTWAATEQTVFTVEAREVRVGSRGRRLSQRHPARGTVILEGEENGVPFAEEAWLENLGFHGAYVLSRHQLDLQARVRVLIDSNGHNVRSLVQPTPARNGHLTLAGYVVRSEPVNGGAPLDPDRVGTPLGPPRGGRGRQARAPEPGSALKYGVAVHFPGVPEP